MERFQIKALPRQKGGKGSRKQLRAGGMVPAVVYGRGSEPLLVTLESTALKKSLSTGAGSNVLLDLEIMGENKTSKETVMVKDLQRHPLQWDIFLHADLVRISLKDKLEVKVPLNYTGEPRGVKEGGVFQIQLREAGVRCMPGDIPQHIDIPIDGLGIGDTLTVADIQLPKGIEMLEDPSENIASVLATHEEKVEEEEAEAGVETGADIKGAAGREKEEE
jgi:large subunit ribosomal protein L25